LSIISWFSINVVCIFIYLIILSTSFLANKSCLKLNRILPFLRLIIFSKTVNFVNQFHVVLLLHIDSDLRKKTSQTAFIITKT